MDPADLNSSCQELSNGGLGIAVDLLVRRQIKFCQLVLDVQSSCTKNGTKESGTPPLKELRFWYNNQFLTPCGCQEAIFVSKDWLCVRMVTVGFERRDGCRHPTSASPFCCDIVLVSLALQQPLVIPKHLQSVRKASIWRQPKPNAKYAHATMATATRGH